MKKIILASKSPRRMELMNLITPDFTVIVSDFNEESIKIENPFELVRELSFKKAESVQSDESIVIGVDTVVCLDDEIFGKPKNKEEARIMLQKLSGKYHSVISGVTVLSSSEKHQFECETKVYFLKLTNEQIESYIETEEPYDKAGGYGIQSKGALFVEKIEGDYFNVVGMPVSRLNIILDRII